VCEGPRGGSEPESPEARTTDFLVEFLNVRRYDLYMSQTLEKRVEELEHKLAELTAQSEGVKPRRKDWRRTFGLSRDDVGFKEMMSLGREYRRNLRDQGNGADS
jgi:hypothetical protein